jgi:hypothetical protein
MALVNHNNERFRYRAAFALNNIAVKLLQCGQFSECISTLKDALNIIRKSSIDIEQALQRAHSYKQPQDHVCGGYLNIHVISSEAHSMHIRESLLIEMDEDHRNLYAITIDGDSFDDGDSPDVEAFAMLYNYGIAYSCLDLYCSEDDSFRSNALNIFLKIQQWMRTRLQKEGSNNGNLYTVHLLVLRSLELSSGRRGSHMAATQYQQTLRQWIEYLRIQEKTLLIFPCGAAAA